MRDLNQYIRRQARYWAYRLQMLGVDGASTLDVDGASTLGVDGASTLGVDGASTLGVDGASTPPADPALNGVKNLKTDAKRAFSAKVVITSVFDDNGKLRGYFVEIPKVLPISTAQPNEGQKPMSTELSTGRDDKLSTMGQGEGVLPANLKEKGEEREKLSPCTPYKRERRAPKEKEGEGEETCARENFVGVPDRATLVSKVAAYNRELKGNIDAAYFVDYYLSSTDGFPRKWKSRLRNWLKTDKPFGRLTPKEVAQSAGQLPAVKLDWTLCAERCKSCTGEGCKRGYLIPPACHPEHPRPPEECPKFTAKEA